MKKLIALAFTALLLLTTVPAFAELMTIPETNLKLDLGEMQAYELSQEDIDDSAVLSFGNQNDTVQAVAYVFEAEDVTLASLKEELEEDETTTAIGYTTINGVEALYWVCVEDGENYVCYFIMDGYNVVQIDFWYADHAAAQETGMVMATLCR